MKDKCSSCKLVIDNVSHDYGGLPVLQNLNMKVDTGEFVVLIGPSGCGKTTLLKLISGHIPPKSGTIHREGTIRTIYQHDGLFPWLTVSENIGMGMRSIKTEAQRKDQLAELFDLIRLTGFEHHYPHQLSGGMRQRVELARVLAGDSDILLMDEPFSSLDYQTRMRMRCELVRILATRPRTVIFVTHDIEEAAQLADRVLVLTGCPSHICSELTINVPRQREVTDAVVTETMKAIIKELGLASMDQSQCLDHRQVHPYIKAQDYSKEAEL